MTGRLRKKSADYSVCQNTVCRKRLIYLGCNTIKIRVATQKNAAVMCAQYFLPTICHHCRTVFFSSLRPRIIICLAPLFAKWMPADRDVFPR